MILVGLFQLKLFCDSMIGGYRGRPNRIEHRVSAGFPSCSTPVSAQGQGSRTQLLIFGKSLSTDMKAT